MRGGVPIIHHGTPITPRDALLSVCRGRATCVSFYRPDDVAVVEQISPLIMYDNGAFSFWQEALRGGREWGDDRDWRPYFEWLEKRLFHDGRWAVIPDSPGAPSQVNDGLLNAWPFGNVKGAPLWHMDGPISRLLRLCEVYDRVCIGWVGEFDPTTSQIKSDQKKVGCDAYRRRMDEVAAALGNIWPKLHMMRGVGVAFDYPFDSADSTSLGRNGHRFDELFDEEWMGRRFYADRLEGAYRGKVDPLRSAQVARRRAAWAHLADRGVLEGEALRTRYEEGTRQLDFAF